jgi:hypothetical protein
MEDERVVDRVRYRGDFGLTVSVDASSSLSGCSNPAIPDVVSIFGPEIYIFFLDPQYIT